jgi:zinc protease
LIVPLLRRGAFVAGSFVLVLASPLQAGAATPGVDAPPAAGAPRALLIPEFEEYRLPNGLRLVVAPRSDLPLVSVALHLRLGAAADPEGHAGLASLAAALRTKGATLAPGAKPLDATQIARQSEALGSTLDSMSDWHGSALSMTVGTAKVDAALALIAAATLHPTLAEDELQRLREQTADGLKLSLSDPMALAGLAARRSFWGASVFGGYTTPSSLARLTRQDVLNFAKVQSRPELATLVFAGDIDLPKALDLARKHLGAWKSDGSPLPEPRRETAAPAAPATVLIDLPGAGQSAVVVMAPAVADGSPERRVAQLASAVLGGGYSARLNQEVRIKRGLSYGASSNLEFQASGGRLAAQTQTKHASAAEVAMLMRSEIVKMGMTLTAPEELAARQATLVGNFGRQIETRAGLAGVAMDLVARGRPLSDAQKLAPELMAVTATQVRDHAAKQWTAERLRTVVVGDLAAAGPSLTALDPQPLRLDAAQLDLEAPGLTRP